MVRDSNIPSINLYPEVVAFVIFIIIYTFGSAISAGFAHLLFRLNGKQAVCEFLSRYVSLLECRFGLLGRITDRLLLAHRCCINVFINICAKYTHLSTRDLLVCVMAISTGSET